MKTFNMKALNKDFSKHPEQYYNIDSSIYKLLEKRGRLNSTAKIEKGAVVIEQETTFDYDFGAGHEMHVNEVRKLRDVNNNGYVGDAGDTEERHVTVNETLTENNGYGTVALTARDEIHYKADYKKDSTGESVSGVMGRYPFNVTSDAFALYSRNTDLAVKRLVPGRKDGRKDPGIDTRQFERNVQEMKREQEQLPKVQGIKQKP
jgi:hypothetical protein